VKTRINSFFKYTLAAVFSATVSMTFATQSFAGDALFSINGKSYAPKDLAPTVRQSIFEADKERYESLSHVIDEFLLNDHLEKEAKKRKLSVDELKHELFTAKPATEKEMKAWFAENKEKIPYPYDKIKNEIGRMLAGEKKSEIRKTIMKKIKSKGKFKNLIPEPVAPLFKIASKGFPMKGAEKANVTLIEFADYQCPHCKRASTVVKNVMKKYGSKVKLVYLDFPINPSGISRQVAIGGVCADAQKKYWEYHYMAFDKQKDLAKDSPEKFAKELGLDLEKFKACVASPEAKMKVAKAEEEGKRVGVQGTPTFFINGRKMQAGDEKQFAKEIDRALKG